MFLTLVHTGNPAWDSLHEGDAGPRWPTLGGWVAEAAPANGELDWRAETRFRGYPEHVRMVCVP